MTMYGQCSIKQMLIDSTYRDAKGGRGLVGLEDCVQVEAHSLEKYLSTSKEKILKVAVESLNEMSVEEVKKKKHREKV